MKGGEEVGAVAIAFVKPFLYGSPAHLPFPVWPLSQEIFLKGQYGIGLAEFFHIAGERPFCKICTCPPNPVAGGAETWQKPSPEDRCYHLFHTSMVIGRELFHHPASDF